MQAQQHCHAALFLLLHLLQPIQQLLLQCGVLRGYAVVAHHACVKRALTAVPV
jgi:hypothetical protein